MRAEQFIKDHGLERAREVVEGAPAWANWWQHDGKYRRSLFDCDYDENGFSVMLSCLKRLVESVDLVKAYGGIEQCRKEVEWVSKAELPETDLVKELKQAIQDYESIYGEGNE